MTWEWFNTGAGAASIVGLIVTIGSVVQGIVGHRTVKSMHRETQETLKALGAGQQSLGEALKGIGDAVKGIGDGQTALGQILDRLDQAAEARYRDLKDRLDDTEAQP